MKKVVALLVIISMILTSCNENDPEIPENGNQTIKKESISGFVQKGPFIIGTSIVISELDSKLAQTGRTFSSQINQNTGSFEIKGIELNSPFIEIKADGFYFNEVSGEVSQERLTLLAIANIKDQSTVNVNVLTTMEKQRLEYLYEQGKTFDEAKKQAQKEVLALFEINKPDIANSESLNLTDENNDNSILIAVSVIAQGDRKVSGVAELLANIGFDLKDNGTIDNQATGSMLINGVKRMDFSKVRENITKRYSELGINISIPDFESIIQSFIENTGFEYTLRIQYPETGSYGPNLLSLNNGDTIGTFQNYSLRAIVPSDSKLKIVFKQNTPKGNVNIVLYSVIGEIAKWDRRYINSSNDIEWKSKNEFNDAEDKITLEGKGLAILEIYENDAVSPTKTIYFSWDYVGKSEIIYPSMGLYGENILAMKDNSVLDKTKSYSVAAVFPDFQMFKYYADFIRTSESGSISYSSVIGWELSGIQSNGYSTFFGTGIPNNSNDVKIEFHGEGSFRLKTLTYYEQIISEKTFTWK